LRFAQPPQGDGESQCRRPLVSLFPVDRFAVIPGRGEAANPESSDKLRICGWIPGSALCAAPE
ncbi:hypothetical protein, partial [Rhodoplanes elegans]|uniref:hypothetical protein n=1 Tax=Rhodoplanes elegans TaxID=29408 RepID=UPI001AEC7841